MASRMKKVRSGRWSVFRSLLVASIAAVAATTAFADLAGAAISSGDQVAGVLATSGTVTLHTPFSSGQNINITVPANSVFNPITAVQIVECTAPNGVLPTDPSSCDGLTQNASTVLPNGDGSVNYQAFTGSLFPIYAIPDHFSLGENPGGPVCSTTVSCVLYIGDNSQDFTQPHIWSSFFYVKANPTDSGVNPGDGSPPPAGATASGTQSMVAASPATAVADGTNSSTVTVTLLSSGGAAVPSRSVTLAQGSGHSIIQPASPGSDVTDATGAATFTVTDLTPESVTYLATDTTDNVAVVQTATVQFQPVVVSQSNSNVSTAQTQVPLNQSSQIVVTLKDQANDGIVNKSITLAGTGSATITPDISPDLTNASGVASFHVKDSVPEVVTFTATDQTDSITLTTTVKVTFGSLTVSPGTSTLTAPPFMSTDTTGGNATVTLLTALNSPVQGKQVQLSLTSPSGLAVVTNGSAPLTTDANGRAVFTLTDPNVEQVTATAHDVTDAELVGSPVTISFQNPAASATVSTVAPFAASWPADGQNADVITVHLKDQFSGPVANRTIILTPSQGSNVLCPAASVGGSSVPGVTDSSGLAVFDCVDTVAEAVTFTATDSTDGFTIQQTAIVTFTAGGANADTSTVTASNNGQAPSDGVTPAVITVTLNDFFGNRVPGKFITLSVLNGSSHLTVVNPITDQNGQATFDAVDSTQEVVTYQATDTTDGIDLTAQGVVIFGHPPAPPPSVPFSDVAAAPPSVVANGTATSLITVTLSDPNGSYVPGKDVTLTAAAGNSKVTGVSVTTGNSGTATFSVSDATAETVTYTATDTSDNVVLKGDEVVVTFTTPSASSSTTTTTSTSSSSPNGSSSAALPVSTGLTPSSSLAGTSASLAATGTPTGLPWLVGLGVFMASVGLLERRRLIRRTR
jgi:hypothetical protein